MKDGITISAAPDQFAEVSFNADGLVPVIAQDAMNGDVLMMAWMNREALEMTFS